MEPRSRHFQKELGRIEQLINALNGGADPTIAAQTRELAQVLLDLHGASLERALDIIHQCRWDMRCLYAIGRTTSPDLLACCAAAR